MHDVFTLDWISIVCFVIWRAARLKGITRIFQRVGWVTLCPSEGTHQIFMPLLPPVRGCSLKKAYYIEGGRTRAPQDTPSHVPEGGGDLRRFPFDQNFVNGNKWQGNFLVKVPENPELSSQTSEKWTIQPNIPAIPALKSNRTKISRKTIGFISGACPPPFSGMM